MLRAKMKVEIDLIMNELVQKIAPIFGDKLKRVVLYGSYARGDFDEESDIDVMFLVDEDEEKLRTYRKPVRKVESELDFKYEVLLCGILQNKDRFYQCIKDVPFYSNVDKEGVVVYEQ
jgi:predicted nucleotidyltransferase